MTTLYVTEMLRWGDVERHHYIVGVYTTRQQAELAGEVEKSWRGGKYEPAVVECEQDAADPLQKLQHHELCTTRSTDDPFPADYDAVNAQASWAGTLDKEFE